MHHPRATITRAEVFQAAMVAYPLPRKFLNLLTLEMMAKVLPLLVWHNGAPPRKVLKKLDIQE